MISWRALTGRAQLQAGGCARHRAVLLDLLDGRTQGRDVDEALEHLGRCDACQREMSEYALVIAGLRRLGAAARRSEPDATGWARVAARLQEAPRRPRWHLRQAPVAGLVALPAVLAVLVAGLLAGGGGEARVAVPAGPAGTDAVSLAAPQVAVPGPQHNAALQRAFRIADTAAEQDPPVACEGAAVVQDEADGEAGLLVAVPPRGPLPDGLAVFMATGTPDRFGGSRMTVAPAIVPE
ncbi:MAG: hypothetical protein ACP5VP_02225 [Candidatus Limnocylindrales bacterium]